MVAKKYNVNKFSSFFDLVEGNLLTLIPESVTLFPLKSTYPVDRFFYIGPQITNSHFNAPKWYDEVKDKNEIFIYLSMGSTAHKLYPYVLKRLVKIFGGMEGINIITNTSFVLNGEDTHNSTPKNIYVADIVEAESMFKISDLTICHGGNGTIYHSLVNGVPVLGISERVEHEMNMKKIKEFNLGDYVLFNEFIKYSDKKIYNLIMGLIKNKEINKNVNKIGKIINDELLQVDNLIDIIRGKVI